MKNTLVNLEKMVEENKTFIFVFNIDEDGYEVSDSTKNLFESYEVEVNEENLVYLAKRLNEDL